MTKNFLFTFCVGALLLVLFGCKTSKDITTTTTKTGQNQKEVIRYYTLRNFPSAEQWVRSDDPETPLISAHRGMPDLPGYAENTLEGALKLISSGSFILELDVAKSKDGVLFLFHDDELDRLTRNIGFAADHTWAELDTMRLYDDQGKLSKSTIPSLEEVLQAGKDKAMFSLDRKQDVKFEKISAVARRLDMLPDVSLILYDIDDFIDWANQETVGPINHAAKSVYEVEQLAQRSRELYNRVGISPFRENKMYPNTGFLGVGLPDKKLLAVAKTLGVKTVVGTFGDLDQRAKATNGQTYRDLVDAGVSIIATNQPLLAHKALYGK